jgi:hypothetical protein
LLIGGLAFRRRREPAPDNATRPGATVN